MISRVRTIAPNSVTTLTTTTLDLRIKDSPNVVFAWIRIFLGHAYLFGMGAFGVLILPVLVLSQGAREMFFAFVYMLIQRLWYNDYGSVRRVVMTGLDDLESHDSALRERHVVRVLEVGAAYGPNLPYVRRSVEYWRLEPNVSFDEGFQQNLDANKKVELVRTIRGHGEDMNMLPDGHFDAVVITYVLCTAIDGKKIISECRRVLRKGGRLLFAEHVGHKKGTFSRFMQDLLAPLAQYMTGGCYMNRDSGRIFKEAGFETIQLEEVDLYLPFEYSFHVYGVAIA
ncbi:thiol S-methyltransferase TMT1A-like [Dermacentor variabilis]|uniref:thiol S-methyltransferase TMT1A-like n=1 Tax=Dermacentor variabilis TaxID=34621 RepID=UPI003F5B4DA8